MKFKRFFPIVLCALMLVFAVFAAGVSGQKDNSDVQKTESPAADDPPKPVEEMRGLWVTYMELDMENEADKSEAAFKDILKLGAFRERHCLQSVGRGAVLAAEGIVADMLYR